MLSVADIHYGLYFPCYSRWFTSSENRVCWCSIENWISFRWQDLVSMLRQWTRPIHLHLLDALLGLTFILWLERVSAISEKLFNILNQFCFRDPFSFFLKNSQVVLTQSFYWSSWNSELSQQFVLGSFDIRLHRSWCHTILFILLAYTFLVYLNVIMLKILE